MAAATITRDLNAQCTRLRCSAHMCMLVATTLSEGDLVMRYYSCPVRGCSYVRADKWGQVNHKRVA